MLLDALNGANQSGRPPVWLMRQAGRYMPQYRALRKKHSLQTMFRTPELIADVTMLPIDLIGVDAAILYSDILFLLDLFGVKWDVETGVGPVIPPNQKLVRRPAEEAIPFVAEGIQLLKDRLDKPLIGFCGGPFTVASYLIEGGSSKQLSKTRAMMYREPEKFAELIDTLTEGAIDQLRLQVDAGVEAVQIFDSWAHWLSGEMLERFSLRPLKRIAESVDVPVILFSRKPIPSLAEVGALSLDWHHNVADARKSLSCPLQGNLDPCLLYASPETIRRKTTDLLESMRGDPAFIVNLGHGILPDIPMENVRTMVDTVKEWA